MHEFWLSILSAFLGFISALEVEQLTKKLEDKNNRSSMLSNLHVELESIRTVAKTLSADSLFTKPYATPIWLGITSSNQLAILNKSPIYSKLIETYSQIDLSNSWETQNCITSLNDPDSAASESLARFVENQRNELVQRITDTLNDWPPR